MRGGGVTHMRVLEEISVLIQAEGCARIGDRIRSQARIISAQRIEQPKFVGRPALQMDVCGTQPSAMRGSMARERSCAPATPKIALVSGPRVVGQLGT